MTTTWHADDELLERYADGDADAVLVSSLEAHVVACAPCRQRLQGFVPAEHLASGWERLVVALDAPRRGWLERLLEAVGIPATTARLLAATEALRWSWLVSIFIASSFAFTAALTPRHAGIIVLVVAPLVPLAGVSVAFNRALDRAADIVDATPAAGFRLTALRTASALVPSLAIAAAADLVVSFGSMPAVWLLPSLALTSTSLLLAPRAPIGTTSAVLAALWAAAVVATEGSARGSIAAIAAGGTPETLLVHPPAQLVAALVAVVAALSVAVLGRRQVQPWRPT